MTEYVYAKESSILHDSDGIGWRVNANEPWDAHDPLVRRNPAAFAAEPSRVGRTRQPVEQATRGPGEIRRRVG